MYNAETSLRRRLIHDKLTEAENRKEKDNEK